MPFLLSLHGSLMVRGRWQGETCFATNDVPLTCASAAYRLGTDLLDSKQLS